MWPVDIEFDSLHFHNPRRCQVQAASLRQKSIVLAKACVNAFGLNQDHCGSTGVSILSLLTLGTTCLTWCSNERHSQLQMVGCQALGCGHAGRSSMSLPDAWEVQPSMLHGRLLTTLPLQQRASFGRHCKRMPHMHNPA